MLAAEIAASLAGLGLVTFDPAGATGDAFVDVLPSAPDAAVMLRVTGGAMADGKLGYDTVSLQVLVRGTTDPRTASARASAIYDALHGLHHVTLPEGTWLLNCRGFRPGSLGRDEAGRHEYTANYTLEIRAVTSHRV